MRYKVQYTIRYYLPVLLLLAMLAQPAFGQVPSERPPEVILYDPPDLQTHQNLTKSVTAVLAAINLQYTDGIALENIISPEMVSGEDGAFGLNELRALTDSTRMFISEEVFTTSIVEMRANRYEIRNIIVHIDLDDIPEHNRTQELVLSFYGDGVLYGARFAIPQHRYSEILSNSISLEDEFRRLQIVNYLERFRTAYNKKDIDFIELQFSEQALIITGTRIIRSEEEELRPNETQVPDSEYRLIRRSKEEYINNLRDNVFRNNTFINVEFSDIEILEHPVYSEVYGINLYQVWESTNYSDDGYLFLMIDYEDETQPKIYVRAWQPEPFEDGSVIQMDMFDLIK